MGDFQRSIVYIILALKRSNISNFLQESLYQIQIASVTQHSVTKRKVRLPDDSLSDPNLVEDVVVRVKGYCDANLHRAGLPEPMFCIRYK